ncbi:carbohydrate kinase family protein [Candidatus Methanoperedens nitratireducens]|uniref:Putative Sugar kinase, ribokinase n=1 Tax=Candidatus Methanoperedens nitratireducens TaxID=1392998 RepID=A0A284VIX5_9EURY|nr:carbohydrate kinase family protein [Candidatus Methanoperedens nitroreducens]SNQ59226.1 putative Sugar kinase, ribokinase [Candidatus Methanoperedens nitroreducens]
MNVIKEELIEKLAESTPTEFKIVVMPHFCIDSSVRYEDNCKSFIRKFKNIAGRGGGNIIVKQSLLRGGKAANCASALLSLGVRTYLITRTDEIGYKLLEYFFKGKDADLSYVSKDGELASSTAIELRGTNVMLSDPGSLSQFGPECLTEKEEKLIREADLVCVSDWGLNKKGTELAEHVFGIVKEEKEGKTFFDPGDPSPKEGDVEEEIERMVSRILSEGLVDIISVNEDEVKRYGKKDNLSRAINHLRQVVRVDLHTEDYVRTFYKDRETGEIPAFDIQPKRLTGAGDAWNAGDIFGEIIGLSDDLRLMLANAVAAYYISDPEGKHPTRRDLMKFLDGASLKSIQSRI